MKGSESAPVDSYLAVGEEVHLASLDEGLQLDVRLGADRAALPRLADHGEPPQQALLAVELSQVGPSVQLDAVLHVGVAAHQTLHVAHVKLLQLENPGGKPGEPVSDNGPSGVELEHLNQTPAYRSACRSAVGTDSLYFNSEPQH